MLKVIRRLFRKPPREEKLIPVDIVDVISSYVSLQKSGNNLEANCPFHNDTSYTEDNTPSFIVFPERQTWRCFGECATGGTVIAFLMRAENLDYRQACNRLQTPQSEWRRYEAERGITGKGR